MPPRVAPITSITLDLTRFLLALGVAVGHFSQASFQSGWPDFTDAAVAAVGGFFLLSGYTIRMLTPRGDAFDAGSYFVERLSRLWSVVLPATVLTIVFDSVSWLIAPDFYSEHWGSATSYPLIRVLTNVFFVGELWGFDVKLFSNSLFWSLSYEAGFYLIYGLWSSREGRARYVLTAIGCLLLGPNIVFMLLVWLVGALLHDAVWRIEPSDRTANAKLALLSGFALLSVMAGGALAGKVYFSRLSVASGELVFAGFTRIDRAMTPFFLGKHVGQARIDGRLIAGAVSFLVLFIPGIIFARALDASVVVPRSVVKVFRRIGDFTFPLYLLHFPALVLVRSLGLYDPKSASQKVLVFVGIGTAIFVFTPYANALKLRLRRRLIPLAEWCNTRLGVT